MSVTGFGWRFALSVVKDRTVTNSNSHLASDVRFQSLHCRFQDLLHLALQCMREKKGEEYLDEGDIVAERYLEEHAWITACKDASETHDGQGTR